VRGWVGGWVAWSGGRGLKYYLFIYLQVHCHPFMEETWPISFIYPFVCFYCSLFSHTFELQLVITKGENPYFLLFLLLATLRTPKCIV
jgi:hypothetical protein